MRITTARKTTRQAGDDNGTGPAAPAGTGRAARRAGGLVRLTAALALATGSIALTAGSAHAATAYKVQGTDGTLAEQSQPATNHFVRWLHEGDTVNVVCQVNDGGTDIGDGGTFPWQNSRTWDKLTDGTWVYDHFITTPPQGADGYSPGVPHCNSSSTLDPNAYPWRVGPDQWVSDGHGYWEGECVSFAAWAIRSDGRPHTKSPDFLGNANQWTGASVSSTPHVGDIAQWDPKVHQASDNGHVAYVAAVNGDGTITVYEYNWLDAYDGYTLHRLSVRTIPASDPSRYLRF
ncbi:CHAP domain-containing protein [Streptomyces sp. NPDC052109]|uniref:CHAP domain-containing protein n=1 Tax=Streptomyces sp. NPDC052109 TaxID=3155527 RepID=UPI00343BD139